MAPENTTPAFDFAMAHAADVLEIDVRLSRDGEIIVIHDETLDRTTNGSGRVGNKLLGELKTLDAAYRFKSTVESALLASRGITSDKYPFRGQGVVLLTLNELFERYPAIGVNIDIKDYDESAIDKVADIISKYQAVDRSVVASFHDSVLSYCRKRYPWLTTSAGMTDVKRFYWWYLMGQKGPVPVEVQLFQLPVKYFIIPLASKRFVNAVHDVGATINYWTINRRSQMVRLLDRGADGIVTDRADLAADLLAARRYKES